MKHGIECTKDMIDATLRENGRFELLKLLGKGSFGCVCQARCLENEEIVAIKMLPRSEVIGAGGTPSVQIAAADPSVAAVDYPAVQTQPQLLWAFCAGEQVCGD